MKALFNGDCDLCRQFRPRCARVYLRVPGSAASYQTMLSVVCEACRKAKRGMYRMDESHRGAGKEKG